MSWYTDSHGNTVSSTTALDAYGNIRPGYRAASDVLQDGERFNFDVMMIDGRAKPSSSSVFLTDEVKAMDGAAFVAAIRDARYCAPLPAHVQRAQRAQVSEKPAVSIADHSDFVSALRTARYL